MDLRAETATGLVAKLATGALTAEALMQATLERIAAENPKVNAIVGLRPADALMDEARRADAVAPAARGPLHGLPIAVKDLVMVKGILSTMGSPAFADHVPDRDDLLAARLRAAGAILIGKTNTPEFGLGSHSFNPVYGATVNPYDPARAAGGSSGGAAAALATGMLALADGSDMMGSLRNPAAWCNVYGFRPTWGVVPSEPVGDLFLHPLSTDGPMARSPEDIALLLGVLARPHPLQPAPRVLPPFDLRASVEGRRIGWLGDWGGAYGVEDGILSLCEDALATFTSLGVTVEPVAPPFEAAKIWQSWLTLRHFAVAARLGVLYDTNPDALKPEAIWEVEAGRALSGTDIQAASAIRSDWHRAAAALFDRYDALVLPSAQVWPFPAVWRYPEIVAGRAMDTYHRWMEVVVPVSLLGLPALAMPAGFGAEGVGKGLPMGMQIFGPRGADTGILQLGQTYHGATDWPGRVPPG
ncbi:amidase [Anianabacter salinae]|uniref:amidase n=1 Tax=Anianabacter salinae TaxID=2851023 RepID=UPI00225E6E09|nr:amidase [Anianabacter salinae]MBV0911686.1 amidase [Anianabacter salinae]